MTINTEILLNAGNALSCFIASSARPSFNPTLISSAIAIINAAAQINSDEFQEWFYSNYRLCTKFNDVKSKAEAKLDSDVDIVVLTKAKSTHLEKFEKQIKRKIQLFWFNSLKEIKDSELKNNILNGYILSGRLRE